MTSDAVGPARRWAVALVLVLVVAACAGSDGASEADRSAGTGPTAEADRDGVDRNGAGDDGDGEAPEPKAYSGDLAGFYEVPDDLAGTEPGDLIRYQERGPVTTGEADEEVGTRYTVMYRSESLAGEPIAVTGVIGVPQGEAPEGGRRLVTIAHGTTGIADECAPSMGPGAEQRLVVPTLVADGAVVAISDYEGLGTPGRHPYLVGRSEGRSVLDAARAAGDLPGARVGDRVGIIGYSQGGHGALWADQIAADWAPELDPVGVVAGAPATELEVILSAADSGAGGFVALLVAGFGAAYPDADVGEVLTPTGEETLSAVDDGCTGDVFDAVSSADGAVFVDAPGEVEAWRELALENNPGGQTSDDPALILHSANDDTVPVALSGILADRMCESGWTLERRVYEDGGGHVEAAPRAYRDGLAWLADRFEGTGEPSSTCEP